MGISSFLSGPIPWDLTILEKAGAWKQRLLNALAAGGCGSPSHPPWQGCRRTCSHEDNEEYPPEFRSYRPLTPAMRNL